MSSKRKSPPTKLDGSNGNVDTTKDVDVMPSAEIDLSIKSSSDTDTNNSETNHHNQLNGERISGKVKRRGGDIQVRLDAQSMNNLSNIVVTVIITGVLSPQPPCPTEPSVEASKK